MRVLAWLLIALGPLLTLIMFLGSQLVTLLRYGGSIPLRIESPMVGTPMYITDLPSGPPGGGQESLLETLLDICPQVLLLPLATSPSYWQQ